MKKIRNSNYELLRIVSMFFIVLYHVLYHGGVVNNTSGIMHLFFYFVMIITMVHVNSFILVSGYYQSESTFKLKKVIELLLTVWFYRVVIILIGVSLNWFEYGTLRLIFELSPFAVFSYWFINIYLILYCLSPFLNRFIDSMDQKTYKRFLILLFFLFSVLTSIVGANLFDNRRGRSPINFIMLYFIGAYFRKYPISNSRIFGTNTREKNGLIFLGLFILCFCINFLMGRFSLELCEKTGWIQEIGYLMNNVILAYDNVFVVLGALFYFLYFGTLKIQNKLINRIAAPVLDIYIIHDGNLRPILYPFLGFTMVNYATPMILVRTFGAAILIYVCCTMIGFFRIWLFHVIGHLKISKKIKKCIKYYINQLSEFKFKSI